MLDYEELKKLSPDKLTERLILLDRQMLMYHRSKDYRNQMKNSYDINADYRSLFNLCVLGICAYNNITLNPNQISREFCKNIMDNLDQYITTFRVPPMMREYYTEVFGRGNLDYLTNFIDIYDNSQSNNKENVKRKAYHLPGKSVADVDITNNIVGLYPDSSEKTAFASVLILPAMLALIYIAVVVIYFVFFYGG